MKRRTVLTIAAASAATALPALAQADRRIVLGQSAAFSGPAAQLGIQMNRGARSYFDAHQCRRAASTARTIELRTLDDRLRTRHAAGPTPKRFIKDDVFALFGYVGTPTSRGRDAAGQRSEDPVLRPVHRRRGAARSVQPLRVPRARQLLRRDRAHRQTADLAGPEEDRGLPPERQLRPGRARRRGARAEGARARAGGRGPGRAQHGRRGRRRCRPSCRSKPDAHRADQRLQELRRVHPREARKAGFGGTFYNVSFVGTQALAEELGGRRAAAW